MDETPGNHDQEEGNDHHEAVFPVTRGDDLGKVHPVDAGYEVRHQNDQRDRGQALHDLAEPVERVEDLGVERGTEQVAIGVQFGQDVDGMVLHVGKIGPERVRDHPLAAEHLLEDVARGRKERRDPQQLFAEPEEIGGGALDYLKISSSIPSIRFLTRSCTTK